MPKVLLIDDDTSLSMIFSTVLSQSGFEVSTAFDGRSGINKTETEKPDIVLLDQVLPDIQGNEVLKEIKSKETTRDIPVVMLSNFSQQELVREALTSGAADYIFKFQVEASDVASKLKEILSQAPKKPADPAIAAASKADVTQ